MTIDMQVKTLAGINTRVVEDREVLMHFGDNPAIDIATGTFMEGWVSAGIEPEALNHGENRDQPSTDTALTGGITETSYAVGAVTGTVELIPGSAVLDYIEWPDSPVEGGVIYRRNTPRVARPYVARAYRFDSGILLYRVSREPADLTVADRARAKDPNGRSVNIKYKTGDFGITFEDVYYYITGEGVPVQVEKKIFQNISDVQAKVAAGTAFVPEVAGMGVTAFVPVKNDDGLTIIEKDEPVEPVDPENP